MLKGLVHCLINYFFTIYSTSDRPIDSDGNNDCLWYTSVDIYTNILVIVSLDLIIDTANVTWINAAIELGTTFVIYIIFLIIVHYSSFFKSFASIFNSVNSPLFWMNMASVGVFCFLFDFSIKSFKYNFTPNLCRELKIIYNEYGPINTTEHVSDRIIEKLDLYDEKKEQNKGNKRKNKGKDEDNENDDDIKVIKIENLT